MGIVLEIRPADALALQSIPAICSHTLNMSNMPKIHRQRIKYKRYTQYQAKPNGEIFQNHALDIMSRMTESHVAMTAKQQSFINKYHHRHHTFYTKLS